MKPERRSMTAALQSSLDLPPEAIALIKAGTPKPLAPAPILAPPESPTPPIAPVSPLVEPPQEAAVSAAESSERVQPNPVQRRGRGRPKGSASRAGEGVERLVGTSFRLPEDLVFRVMKAAADRKIRRIRPWAQQDIVSEALQAWLKTAGY